MTAATAATKNRAKFWFIRVQRVFIRFIALANRAQ